APDGKTILYVQTRTDRETQKNVAHSWIVASDGRSDPKLFTSGFSGEAQPRFSPEVTRVAFVASKGEGERPQIWVARATGGEATKVSNVENGVTGFVWAPDN